MQRILWLSSTLIVALTTQAAPARAQFYYGGPFAGWGCYGYGGWSSTVQGDIARGLGDWAAGAGMYNELTAQADSIDTSTLIRWNQYLSSADQAAGRSYLERHRMRRNQIAAAREKTCERLRNRPDARDIASGDALNLALDDLNNARTSLHNLKRASVRLDGALVRDIPLQCPAGATTINVNELLDRPLPAALTGAGFAAERQALTGLISQLRKERGEQPPLSPETIAGGIDLLRATQDKVEHTLPLASAARRDAEAYLKGLSGLFTMLGTPAANVLLAGTDGRPETTLGKLLDAMNLCDLRFGVARTARQRSLYSTLYPLLASVRDESRLPVAAAHTAGPALRQASANRAGMPSVPVKKQIVLNLRAARAR
jgi:hypothetical protein